MKQKSKLLSLVPLCLSASQLQAVQLSTEGVGEVLIYSYYTVNKDLNTLYSIVNTTDQAKALKVRFLEGENGQNVLNFNVYLSPFDVWVGALVPTTSTIQNHVNELSVLHVSNDTSCVPYLNKSGQEFLPYVIELDQPNDNLLRARDGHIEVLEMGVLAGDAAAAVEHDNQGIPNDCEAIELAWSSGEWSMDALQEPTGGLYGSASLVNVGQGISFSYDAIALNDFWQRLGEHTETGSLLPDLSSAIPRSFVLMPNGVLANSRWHTGFEAVSAVLMSTEVYNEYAHDIFINGKSEWVLTFPTKSYHVNPEAAASAPFTMNWNGIESCDEIAIQLWDREEQVDPPFSCGGITCPPIATGPEICYSSNVLEFLANGFPANTTSEILGADNKSRYETVAVQHATESGWAQLNFLNQDKRMIPVSGAEYEGLPVTGFVVQQFTNAGAADGLLAQYGSLFKHKSMVVSR